ncbi:MAG: DUF4488 domain-containing protein [Phocaeicola sp.]
MKLRNFLASLLLLAFGSVMQLMGQAHPTSNLAGIWQMYFYVSGSPNDPGVLKPSNSFKVLSAEGRFTNFTLIPTQGSIIIGEGRYHQTNDDAYVEVVERNIHLPQLNEKENVMHFTMEDDLMHVRYFLERDVDGNEINTWCYETWKKVTMPAVYPKDLAR